MILIGIVDLASHIKKKNGFDLFGHISSKAWHCNGYTDQWSFFLNQTMPLISLCLKRFSQTLLKPFGLKLLWNIVYFEVRKWQCIISHDDNRASKPTEFENAWIVWIIRNSMWKCARAGKGLWWYSQTCKIYLRLITSSLETKCHHKVSQYCVVCKLYPLDISSIVFPCKILSN